MNRTAEDYRHRYGTALISDAAFRGEVACRPLPREILPLAETHKLAGPAVTIEARNDLVAIMAAVHAARSGDVVVISNTTHDVGLIGDIIATEARRKGLAGVVVDGCVRDKIGILETGLPVYCRGVVPVGPLKLDPQQRGIGKLHETLEIGGSRIDEGTWMFGDADGVVAVEPADLDTVMNNAASSRDYEERLLEEIRAGAALGDVLQLERFLEERRRGSEADFNAHLKKLGRAI